MATVARRGEKVFLIAMLAFLAISPGCKKDDVVTENPPGVVIPAPPAITEFGGITPSTIVTVIRVSTELQGIPFLLDVTTASARFGNPGTDRGDVKAIADTTEYLFTKSTTAAGVSYTLRASQAHPVGIQLTGGSSPVTMSATNFVFSESVATVPGQLKITAPIPGATIPRSQNLNVTWTVAGPGQQAAVYITDGVNHVKFYQGLGNVTSFTIPSADLVTLNQGTGYLYAVSYNIQPSNSNDAVLIGEATFLQTFELR